MQHHCHPFRVSGLGSDVMLLLLNVSAPTFIDPSDLSTVKCRISTRQLVCCRETCTECRSALCGYSSELCRDSHFESTSVPHRCKGCYRKSKSAPTSSGSSTSTPAPPPTSNDSGGTWDNWQPTSSSWGAHQGSGWDSWAGQWSWY